MTASCVFLDGGICLPCRVAGSVHFRCARDMNVWANFVEKAVAFHRTVKLGPEAAAVTSNSMGVYRSLEKGKLAWGLR